MNFLILEESQNFYIISLFTSHETVLLLLQT